MRTAASFRLGGTLISARRLTILKLYKILEILRIKVLKIRIRIFAIKRCAIQIRKHAGAMGALGDISPSPPPEDPRKYPRGPPPRLKRRMFLAMG
jgi:hypothetical protein